MKDYNFFSVYDRKKGINIDSKSPYFIASIMVLIFALLSAGLVVRNILLSDQLQQMNEEIAVIQETKAYKDAIVLRNTLDKLNLYDEGAKIVLADFERQNVLGTTVLDRLSASMPSTVSTVKLNVDHAILTGEFSIPDKKTGAELLMQLEESGLFEYVHSPDISKSGGQAGFVITVECEMKAGEAE